MLDLASLFEITVDPLELVLRGTVMYWFLFLLLRFVLRRDIGSIGIADVLLLVVIADAAQNAMSGGYESITDGMILVGTIAAWNWGLDRLAYRFRSVRRVLEAKPLELVRDGKLMRRNMRKEYITPDEIMAKLREHGVDKLEAVKVATMESDGEITVIQHEGQVQDSPSPARGVPPG
ncbi:MAG: hypothetical protein K0Q43_3616 [Ramlibacter sp.]|jgi:uncharacterized membrane protein YcaP (DUF421 family)|nr:hypothetical protein [Ramlibacter sp.]